MKMSVCTRRFWALGVWLCAEMLPAQLPVPLPARPAAPLATDAVPARAAPQRAPARAAAEIEDVVATPAEPETPPQVEIEADRLEYDMERKLMIGAGNVTVRQGPDVLRADYVTVRSDTQDAFATGNVLMERDGTLWRGDELSYNFKTRQGDFGEFIGFVDPFYVRAAESERESEDLTRLRGVRLTTCEGDDPEFVMRARRAELVDGTKVKIYHAVFFLGPFPVFYLPYGEYDFTRRTHIDFQPGFSSRWGAFALTAYNWWISNYVELSHRVDYYSERGWGFGQDIKWEDTNSFGGLFRAYYIDDQRIYRNETQEEIRGDKLTAERYRFRLEHTHNLTERDYLIADFNYMSDEFVLEDFFRREFRRNAEPETRASLTHRGDRYTASILADKRLNEFYDHVDRFPEITLALRRQRLGSSPFYYQGAHVGAYLERQYAYDEREPYDALRLDSDNFLYWPTRHFGFLNLVPRAGYRATFYSKTIGREDITVSTTQTVEVVVGEVTNLVQEVTQTNTTRVVEGSADIRNVYQLGLETSFKAFKVFVEPDALGRGGVRHVFEPYANYTFVPEPDLMPTDLYQFDDVDGLTDVNHVRVGAVNRFQTKQPAYYIEPESGDTYAYGSVRDVVELDVYTFYRLDPEPEQEDFDWIYARFDLRPSQRFRMDFTAAYDPYASELQYFNTRAILMATDQSMLSLEHRYELDRRNVLTGGINLFPGQRVSLNSSMRYDLDESELLEHNYSIEYRTGCVGYGLGYSNYLYYDDEEHDVWARIWLLAFPKSYIGATWDGE
ncbi:MAG: hypothetical protein K9N49_03815 [Candidatus Marinimicrobia bacterium]|nr:hypothetical protein [Candidatus Neomarinimicrobiota bacterium]